MGRETAGARRLWFMRMIMVMVVSEDGGRTACYREER